MTNSNEDKIKKEDLEEFNNIVKNVKKEDESVSQNLILTGFKICNHVEFLKQYFQFN